MMIIGVDYHPSFQTIAFLMEETGECGEQELNHSDGQAEKFYRDLKQRGISVRVGMEATGYSRWFERLLAELEFEVWMGDPAEIKAKRVKKQKFDREDARLLRRLMLENNFPQIWVPSPENQDLRQLLWHRHRLVQMRTRIMNQLQALAMNEGYRWKKKLFSEQGRAQLEKLTLAPWASRRRRELLELLDRMHPTIESRSTRQGFSGLYSRQIMALAPGTKLGPYQVVAPIGAGGMGEVYRAKDARLDRDVAIKILPQEMCADPARKQRFEREAKTISGLNHPNICVLYDVGRQDGVDYLVMECIEGGKLPKRIEKGPLPLEQLLKYGAQIADALDKAHRAGIVHRDLKPTNIMLTSSGAKLLDFGLAKPASAPASLATLTMSAPASPVTQEGTVVGTFQYMSPEQVEGRELDGRSDIFSLGAVLYEMWTGQRAFAGKSQLSVASSILEKERGAITSLRPLTPSALDRTIKKCLEKAPDDRWQSSSDL